jgi:hypothetical protein
MYQPAAAVTVWTAWGSIDSNHHWVPSGGCGWGGGALFGCVGSLVQDSIHIYISGCILWTVPLLSLTYHMGDNHWANPHTAFRAFTRRFLRKSASVLGSWLHNRPLPALVQGTLDRITDVVPAPPLSSGHQGRDTGLPRWCICSCIPLPAPTCMSVVHGLAF